MKCIISKYDNIIIIGGGISGLIAANFLKLKEIPFKLVSMNDDHGFGNFVSNEFKFKLGQRTLFYDVNIHKFLTDIGLNLCNGDIVNLADSIGVYYKNEIHNYPIQFHLSKLKFIDKLKFYWSYFNRNKEHQGDYLSWTKANYGKWLSEEILLPHTWKTLKEDLSQIDCQMYGKKVIPLNFFGHKKIEAFEDTDRIIKFLIDRIKDDIIYGKVTAINLQQKKLFVDKEIISLDYDLLLNTTPVNKLLDMTVRDEMIDVAQCSLQYNNMFAAIFILPTSLVKSDKNIIYFPEKKYIFSKIIRDRKNGYTVLVCECSFRRNDEGKFQCQAYREKFLDRIEYDLRKSGIILGDIISSQYRDYKIISPCYIITDMDYKVSNDFIQSYCEHNMIYNIGRFAQFQPNLRAEHSLKRIEQIWQLFQESVPEDARKTSLLGKQE